MINASGQFLTKYSRVLQLVKPVLLWTRKKYSPLSFFLIPKIYNSSWMFSSICGASLLFSFELLPSSVALSPLSEISSSFIFDLIVFRCSCWIEARYFELILYSCGSGENTLELLLVFLKMFCFLSYLFVYFICVFANKIECP